MLLTRHLHATETRRSPRHRRRTPRADVVHIRKPIRRLFDRIVPLLAETALPAVAPDVAERGVFAGRAAPAHDDGLPGGALPDPAPAVQRGEQAVGVQTAEAEEECDVDECVGPEDDGDEGGDGAGGGEQASRHRVGYLYGVSKGKVRTKDAPMR